MFNREVSVLKCFLRKNKFFHTSWKRSGSDFRSGRIRNGNHLHLSSLFVQDPMSLIGKQFVDPWQCN